MPKSEHVPIRFQVVQFSMKINSIQSSILIEHMKYLKLVTLEKLRNFFDSNHLLTRPAEQRARASKNIFVVPLFS